MSESSLPSGGDRRRFLKLVGLAGITSGLLRPPFAWAQGPAPTPGATPAPAAPPAEEKPPEISEDARSLADILRRRYGQHLSPDQLEALAQDLDDDVKQGRRLRAVKLANGDEPDFTFHA